MPTDHIASCMSEPAAVQARMLEFVRNGVFSAGIEVTEETDLVANGFDSLSLVSLLVFIEKTYGLWIPQNEITETSLKNIKSLSALVIRLLNERQSQP